MRIRKTTFLKFIILISLTIASSTPAKTLIVYPGQSFQEAFQSARPGDTIRVKPGVSEEDAVGPDTHNTGTNDNFSHADEKTGAKALMAGADNAALEPDMVVIQPGSYLMGSSLFPNDSNRNDTPRHLVKIIDSFELGKYEVTFAQYDRFAQATGRQFPDDNGFGRGNRPVMNVSFDDALAYVQWLSQKTGKNYRLPIESEWEYAARAGSKTLYSWGDQIDDGINYAWFSKNSFGRTHPVGQKMPNAFGVHDIAGNVWEYTQDCWHEKYDVTPADGLPMQEKDGGDCSQRVVRGGSWDDNAINTDERFYVKTGRHANWLGFRIARTL